ncbi:MAG: helix-turn-helix transcriptional regulator [Cyanobacteria bacterium P01_D01_bin.6]
MKRDEPNPKSVFVQLRKKMGLSQKTVAQELEVNEQTVRNWEHGRTVPTLTIPQMKRLCKLLQLPIEAIPDKFGPTE